MNSNYQFCILVNSLTGGGAEKVATTLLNSFEQSGYKVALVCLEKNDVYEIGDSDVFYLSDHSGSGESGFKKLLYLPIFAWRLKKLLRSLGINQVQSHIYRSNYVNVIASIFGSKHRKQIVNHGIAGRYRTQGLLGRVNIMLMRLLYPRAEEIICPTAGMLNDIKLLGIGVQKGIVIGNPFPCEIIQKESKTPTSHREFHFDIEKKYLIAVGRLDGVKRQQDIVQALAGSIQSHSNLELIILGEGDEHDELKALAERLGVLDRLHLLGHVSNPYWYVSKADIFVSASQYEGFSNVIVEAMLAGTAVLSSDCEYGPREILAPDTDIFKRLGFGEIEYAKYGVLIAVGDVNAMTLSIDKLLKDPMLRSDYEHSGLRRGKDFDEKKVAAAHIKLLSTDTE